MQCVMFSKRLSCVEIEKHKFNCTSTVESAWVRIWDTKYYKWYIEKCGIQWHEKYQDVMYPYIFRLMRRKVPCMDGDSDMMQFIKERVGMNSTIILTVSKWR